MVRVERDVGVGGALLVRGMRWRLGTSLLTVLTSAIAVGAAVLGPLYLSAAGDSVVRSTIASAPVDARGATLLGSSEQGASLREIQRAEQMVDRAGGDLRWYGAPITSVISGVGLAGPGSSPLHSQLLWRSGICHVLRFRRGSCELGFGDVLVSDRSARELRVSLGGVIDASVPGSTNPLRLRVTGVYAVPNLTLAYWWGDGAGYFGFGHTSGPKGVPEIDSLIASATTGLAVPVQGVPEVVGQLPLRADRVGLATESSLERGVSRTTTELADRGITLSTRLPALLAGARQQRHMMSTIVVVAAVQLVLLAIWVLGSLLVRSGDARRSEIRVARLRGFPAGAVLMVSSAEPAILCLLGILLGIAGAWGAMVVVRDRLLIHAAAISPDRWTVAALAMTVLAIACALGAGTARLMRLGLSPDAAAVSGGTRRRSVIVDVVLLVLSVVALVALDTSGALAGPADPIASAAPGLIALGTAVIAVHIVLFGCRLAVSATACSDRVAAFLAVRQIARRPGVLRQARVLIIALCLVCFATAAWSVARRNRAAAAAFGVGTTAVATVGPPGVGLEQAVDRVDPRGRFAMAAVAVSTPSSTLLAVDARRLAVVASWPAGISNASAPAVAHALDPPTAPQVTLPGRSVQVLATSRATSLRARGIRNLDLGLWVFNPQVGTTFVNLGPLHVGERTYVASLATGCPGGCRLAGLGLVPAPTRGAPFSGGIELVVKRVATRTPLGALAAVSANLRPGAWEPTAQGVGLGTTAMGGLSVSIPARVEAEYAGAQASLGGPMASPADHPAALPGAVTSEVESINGGSGRGNLIPAAGLDGNTLDIKPAVTTSALPRMGGDAVMVDLDLLARSQVDTTSPYASDEVWLGPAAPANALARLRAAGLRIDSVQRASRSLHELERSGPALADDFLLLATVLALLAAAASTLSALGPGGRERATELIALEVAGVRRPVLVRSLLLESSVLALTALFGAAAGVLTAFMAVPSLPELTAPSLVPLRYGLPGALLAAVSAVVVAVVLVASGTVSVALIRRMSPSLLRTAPDDASG